MAYLYINEDLWFMDTSLIILLTAVVCLTIGYFLGNYIRNLKAKSDQSTLMEQEKYLSLQKQELEKQLSKEKEDSDKIRAEKEQLNLRLTRYEADMENLKERNTSQQEEIEKVQEKFTKEFENLANKILEEKSSKFTKKNKENK